MIDKEKFRKYVVVQKSGVTNMFDVKRVCSLSGLNEEDCFDIMKNYSLYKEKYSD